VLDNPPVVLFKCDAHFRGKIGLLPTRTRGIIGSMDWKRNILTIVKTKVDPNGLYLANTWEYQDAPYSGDALNSYNDGPVGPKGEQFGSFYELETVSPARELKPGEELTHKHLTVHFRGDRAKLNEIAKKVLGADLEKLPRL